MTNDQGGQFGRGLLLIALLAFGLRTAVLTTASAPLRDDPDGYRRIAANLAAGGEFAVGPGSPTAFRPPLYPALLAAIGATTDADWWRIAGLHAFLGGLTVAGIFGIAWHLGGPWLAWISGVLVLVDPILLHQSTQVMTETLATLLVVACLVVRGRPPRLTPMRGAVVGALLGLASLCRPPLLVWALSVVAWSFTRLAWSWMKPSAASRRRTDLLGQSALLLALALVLAPWTIRNAVVMQKGSPLTTHGGYTLWLGNNPFFYEHLRRHGGGRAWDSQPLNRRQAEIRAAAGGDEVAADRLMYGEAFRAMRRDPGGLVRASLVRLARFWQLMPHAVSTAPTPGGEAMRWAIGLWYSVQSLLAVVGAVALGRQLRAVPWSWGLLLAVSLSLVHLLYWSNMRMRAPLIPWLSLLAAYGAIWSARTWLPQSSILQRLNELPAAQKPPCDGEGGSL